MDEISTTASRKPSRLWATIKLILFFPLYAAALFVTTALSLSAVLVFWNSDTIQRYQIVTYWLHQFNDQPGVRGYATELLKQDALLLHPLIVIGEVIGMLMPLILLWLGVQCIRRKTIDLALNPVFCWLYSSVIFLFAFAFSGFSSMLFAAVIIYP